MKKLNTLIATVLSIFFMTGVQSAMADWDQRFSGIHCVVTNDDGLDRWSPQGDVLMGNSPIYAACPIEIVNGISSSDFVLRHAYLHATQVTDARLCRRIPEAIGAGVVECGTSNQINESWYLNAPPGPSPDYSRYYINVTFNKGATPALIFEYQVHWQEI